MYHYPLNGAVIYVEWFKSLYQNNEWVQLRWLSEHQKCQPLFDKSRCIFRWISGEEEQCERKFIVTRSLYTKVISYNRH